MNKTGILFNRRELRNVTACVPFLEQTNNICFGVLDQLQANKRRIQEREKCRMQENETENCKERKAALHDNEP